MENYCRDDLFQKLYLLEKRRKYTFDEFIAISDIGKIRKYQEDAIIVDVHPNDNAIKLMAVADGMGGLNHGFLASNIALRELTVWFESASCSILVNKQKLILELNEFLSYVDDMIRLRCSGGGTTLALAIIDKDDTLCVNIGDCRIYCTSMSNLQQISTDHSNVWNLWEQGDIPHKEDMLFHRKNHLILSRLGCERRLLTIDHRILPNNDYDDLFLFSDGITDCMFDQQLANLIFSCKELPDAIVDFALDNNLVQNHLNNIEYYNKIEGGKDNATVVMYSKKRKR